VIPQTASRGADAWLEMSGAKSYEPFLHVERAELARLAGDEARRRRELREAHRLFTKMGAPIRAAEVARELESVIAWRRRTVQSSAARNEEPIVFAGGGLCRERSAPRRPPASVTVSGRVGGWEGEVPGVDIADYLDFCRRLWWLSSAALAGASHESVHRKERLGERPSV
jgi:hypothetical protein